MYMSRYFSLLVAVLTSLSLLAPRVTIGQELRDSTPLGPHAEGGFAPAPPLERARSQPQLPKSQIPARVSLDPVLPERLTILKMEAATQPTKSGVPLKIGYGRNVTALSNSLQTSALMVWSSVPGGQVAAISITSPNALGVRLGLLVEKLPNTALLRFYSQGASQVFEVTGQKIMDTIANNLAAGDKSDRKAVARNHAAGNKSDMETVASNLAADDKSYEAHTYWSPVIEGQEITVEIELPVGVSPDDVRFSIPRVSHLFSLPLDTRALYEKIGQSSSCNLDSTCYTSTWGIESLATAKMTFTEGGSSYLCTGTLMIDKDASTYIPFFLTANHCISTQTVASSLQTYWFYRSASCNSSSLEPSNQTLTGGATLLHASSVTDTSFMRLNSAPPSGAYFSGWLTNLQSLGASVTGIHNPSGDLQKISFGAITDYSSCASSSGGGFSCTSAVSGSADYFSVGWSQGITEGGSSGSGLWVASGSSHYLVGQLYGGSSFCSSPTAEDYYGRFDVAYNAALYQWLGATSSCTSFSLNPSSQNFTASAATGTVSVTASTSCTWSAISNVSWITITSGLSGSDSGVVGFSVAANISTNSRTGTLTIGGQTFTVTQAGSGGGTITQMPTLVGTPNYSGLFTYFGATASLTFWRESIDNQEHLFVKVGNPTASSIGAFFFCPSGSQFSIVQNGHDYGTAFRVTRNNNVAVCEDLYTSEIFLVDQWSSYPNFIEANAFVISYVPYGSYLSGSINVGGSGNAQTIAAISFSPTMLTIGGYTTASATATSGLAVTFSSLTPSVCTVSGSTVTGITAGTCTIAANQAGNASYNAATQVTQSITIGTGIAGANTLLEMPWFTKVGGYISRFVLLNAGSSAASFNISILTEVGNLAVINSAQSSGSIPANSQYVINIDDLIQSFSAGQRAAAIITSSAPSGTLTGIYNLVQPSTGAISNVSLLRGQDFTSSSSVLLAPWLSTASGYASAFILTNAGSTDATATVSFLAPSDTLIGPKLDSLTVPAQSQLIVDTNTLLTLTGGSSAAAVFSFNAPEGYIKGTYKIVNTTSGTASNTELVNSQSSGGSTTRLVTPWFSTALGYSSSFILTNRGSTAANYTATVMTEPGNTATTGSLSGSIPAREQIIIPASSIVSSFTGATRASAIFDVSGSPANIEGEYGIVSLGTGAISTTILARGDTSGSMTTTLKLPWFSGAFGYISRFVLVNRGSTDAPFTIRILPEAGNSVTQILTGGTIPARGKLVLPITDVISGFATATRAAAVFTVGAPAADIDGLYNIVNPVSGTISNTMMGR